MFIQSSGTFEMHIVFVSAIDFVYSLVLLSGSMGSQREEGFAAAGDKYVMGSVGGHLTLYSGLK